MCALGSGLWDVLQAPLIKQILEHFFYFAHHNRTNYDGITHKAYNFGETYLRFFIQSEDGTQLMRAHSVNLLQYTDISFQ